MRKLATAAVFAFAPPAMACGVCAMAITDSVLPPIGGWMLFALVWFVLNGAIRSWTGTAMSLQPRLPGTIAVLLIAIVAAAMAFGPLTILPLAIPPAWTLLRACVPRTLFDMRTRRAILVTGSFAVIAAATLTVMSVHEHRTRTEAEYIAKWRHTGPGRMRFEMLRRNEPASLPTYRELLRIGNEYIAAEAAERIGVAGDPAIDVPLLREALVRFSSIRKDDRQELTKTLEALRGENAFEVRVPGGPSRWATEKSGEWEAVRPELVCEVEYDYFSQGRFRHGSKFLRWRPEKKPTMCGMDQVLPAKSTKTVKSFF